MEGPTKFQTLRTSQRHGKAVPLQTNLLGDASFRRVVRFLGMLMPPLNPSRMQKKKTDDDGCGDDDCWNDNGDKEV